MHDASLVSFVSPSLIGPRCSTCTVKKIRTRVCQPFRYINQHLSSYSWAGNSNDSSLQSVRVLQLPVRVANIAAGDVLPCSVHVRKETAADHVILPVGSLPCMLIFSLRTLAISKDVPAGVRRYITIFQLTVFDLSSTHIFPFSLIIPYPSLKKYSHFPQLHSLSKLSQRSFWTHSGDPFQRRREIIQKVLVSYLKSLCVTFPALKPPVRQAITCVSHLPLCHSSISLGLK